VVFPDETVAAPHARHIAEVIAAAIGSDLRRHGIHQIDEGKDGNNQTKKEIPVPGSRRKRFSFGCAARFYHGCENRYNAAREEDAPARLMNEAEREHREARESGTAEEAK